MVRRASGEEQTTLVATEPRAPILSETFSGASSSGR
jgi:hypothetical protein